MQVKVFITLKEGVLDPQGQTVADTLKLLGFEGVQRVRQGKYIEIDLLEEDVKKAQKEVESMCDKLLANTIVENYRIDI